MWGVRRASFSSPAVLQPLIRVERYVASTQSTTPHAPGMWGEAQPGQYVDQH